MEHTHHTHAENKQTKPPCPSEIQIDAAIFLANTHDLFVSTSMCDVVSQIFDLKSILVVWLHWRSSPKPTYSKSNNNIYRLRASALSLFIPEIHRVSFKFSIDSRLLCHFVECTGECMVITRDNNNSNKIATPSTNIEPLSFPRFLTFFAPHMYISLVVDALNGKFCAQVFVCCCCCWFLFLFYLSNSNKYRNFSLSRFNPTLHFHSQSVPC